MRHGDAFRRGADPNPPAERSAACECIQCGTTATAALCNRPHPGAGQDWGGKLRMQRNASPPTLLIMAGIPAQVAISVPSALLAVASIAATLPLTGRRRHMKRAERLAKIISLDTETCPPALKMALMIERNWVSAYETIRPDYRAKSDWAATTLTAIATYPATVYLGAVLSMTGRHSGVSSLTQYPTGPSGPRFHSRASTSGTAPHAARRSLTVRNCLACSSSATSKSTPAHPCSESHFSSVSRNS